jgi:four helix bundle protein
MQDTTIELLQRTGAFAVAINAFCDRLPTEPGAQRIARKLRASSKAIAAGYQDVSVSRSPEEFITRISMVARQAKRARGHVQMLLQLNHVTIEATRDLLLEARALEAIFRKSRETAKRHQRHTPGRLPTAGEAQEIIRRRRRLRPTASRRPSSSGTP